MTAPGEEHYALGRPPILAIVMGLVHAVVGGVLSLLCARELCMKAFAVGYSLLHGQPTILARFAGSYALLFFFGIVLAAACVFVSGLWLLRGDPRGRRWTVALFVLGILCGSALIAWDLIVGGRGVDRGFVACCLVYCPLPLIVMYLPSVRRAYARTGHASVATKSV